MGAHPWLTATLIAGCAATQACSSELRMVEDGAAWLAASLFALPLKMMSAAKKIAWIEKILAKGAWGNRWVAALISVRKV